MRLLFVTPQVPWPPTQGTALRNFHLLRAASEAHEVDLLSFGSGEAPAQLSALCGRAELVPLPRRTAKDRLRDLAMGWADMERRLWSPAMAARLEALLTEGDYDVVQLEGFEVAGYLLGPAALRREAQDFSRRVPKLVFDDHNAEFELQRSAASIDRRVVGRWPRALYSTVQARRLRRREALYACAADVCLAVSAEDAVALERVAPGVGPVVVPNGVDCAAAPGRTPAVQPTLLFSGKLDYRPNVDACEWLMGEIMPRVWAAAPAARVTLAGRDPAPAVRALAGPRVEVTGEVSEADLAARRGAARVYVVPMRMGSGVRFKVLEAMAASMPIVTTSLGASGTGAVDGEHVLIRDDEAGFALAIIELLGDEGRRERLGAAARGLAEREHDWSHISPRLLAVYRALEAPCRPRASAIATVRNERDSVGRLISSLEDQLAPPDEVVIVDGGSVDGTAEVLKEAGVRAMVAAGANISAGRNRAIEAARHEVILATDAGVELHPAWAERMMRAMAGPHPNPLPEGEGVDQPLPEGEAVRSAGEGAVRAASGFFVSAPQSAWELALGATTLPDVGEIDPARFLPSSRSVAFTRAAWERAGRYPEWLDYCEDLVFDLGLIAAGVRPRFVPRAVARFRPRSSPERFFHQYFRYARGDGKADLWRMRHAVRYATYAVGSALGLRTLRGDWWALGVLTLGGLAYLRDPLVRLSQQARDPGDFLRAAPLVPVARVLGDVAKMAGYPAGVLWRWRRRRM